MKLVFSIIGLVEFPSPPLFLFFDQCWDIKNKALAAHATFISSYHKSISVCWKPGHCCSLVTWYLLLHPLPRAFILHFCPGCWPTSVYWLSFIIQIEKERRRKRQLTPVFSPGESHGQRSLGQLIHPFQPILVWWFLKCQRSLLPSVVWPLLMCLDSWT